MTSSDTSLESDDLAAVRWCVAQLRELQDVLQTGLRDLTEIETALRERGAAPHVPPTEEMLATFTYLREQMAEAETELGLAQAYDTSLDVPEEITGEWSELD